MPPYEWEFGLRSVADLMTTLAAECFKDGSNNNVAECAFELELEGKPQFNFVVAPNDMIFKWSTLLRS